jgi:outer membrane protein OmpA-like peptidoglycan-associated protein
MALVSVTAAAAMQTAPRAAPTIPLCPGLTIVTAVSQPQGDYESIKRVESVGAEGVRIRYSSYMPDPASDNDSTTVAPAPWVPFVVHRSVRRGDLEAAASYMQQFAPQGVPETVKGTTALGISSNSFRELRNKGTTALTIYQAILPAAGVKDDGGPVISGMDYRMAGELARIDPAPVPVSVLVNDRLTTLPALRAKGKFLWDDAEFFFLYDEANPISLKFRIGIREPMPPQIAEMLKQAALAGGECRGCAELRRQFEDRDVLQVVKISHRCEDSTLRLGRGGEGEAPQSGDPVTAGVRAGGGARGGGAGDPGAGGGAAGGGGAARGTGGGAAGTTTAALLEESLTKSGRAEVYSIYFAFNRDEIREESEPTLQEIADVLRRHPDWKLAIEGHTDNIASDGYNLQLSQKRAAAVKNALVSKKGIGGTRLTTGGFGESRPKDTNDTLEGRARNRRVELVRIP